MCEVCEEPAERRSNEVYAGNCLWLLGEANSELDYRGIMTNGAKLSMEWRYLKMEQRLHASGNFEHACVLYCHAGPRFPGLHQDNKEAHSKKMNQGCNRCAARSFGKSAEGPDFA